MSEPNQTHDSTTTHSGGKSHSLVATILIGGLIGVGFGGLDRLVCQKKIENIKVTEVGTMKVEYGGGLIEGDYEDNSYYKDEPMIYVTGHDKCFVSNSFAGIKVGDKFAWIRYSSSSDKCDELEEFEKKE